jgi:hypothetical protein
MSRRRHCCLVLVVFTLVTRGVTFTVRSDHRGRGEPWSSDVALVLPHSGGTRSGTGTITCRWAVHSSPSEDSDPSGTPSLGIQLGVDYGLSLTENDRNELKSQMKEVIHQSVQRGLQDLQELHDKWERDMPDQLLPLEQAMTLNGIQASKVFETKLDVILGSFNNQTAVSRQKTHDLFRLSELEQAQRRRDEQERQHAHERRRRRRAGLGELEQYDDGSSSSWLSSSPTPSSWKKTNDAWDDWEEDSW